jgi:hypothetical protein
MITTTWSVNALNAYPEKAGESDVVFSVQWTCTATDGTYTTAIPGSTGVTWDPSQPFTPYDQLTEAQVLGWVWSAMGDERFVVEGYAAKGVEDQVHPPVVSPPLPWAPPPPPPETEPVPDAPPAPPVEEPAPVAELEPAPAPSNE